MANIIKVQPTHVIDEGRLIFNQNDTNLNNEITSLSNTLNTHNHNSLYYTKTEINSLLNKENFVLLLGVPQGGSGTYPRVGNISMSAQLEIAMPLNCNLEAVDMVSSNGEKVMWTISPAVAYALGDRFNIFYVEGLIPPGSTTANYAGFRVLKNGIQAAELIWKNQGASTQVAKILNIIFKRT